MVMTDTFSGIIKASVLGQLARAGGNFTGTDVLSHDILKNMNEGSGTGAASGWCAAATLAITTSGADIDLASATDPFGAIGDEVPTMAPTGTKLKVFMIENLDATNYVTLKPGAANSVTNWFGAATHTIRIPALGWALFYFDAGQSTLTAASTDRINITANTGTCNVKLTYIFG